MNPNEDPQDQDSRGEPMTVLERARIREIAEMLDRCVKPFVGPQVEAIPPGPGDDPTVLRARITGIPLEWFIGRSAAELRAAGATVDPKVPDCATVKRQEDGRIAFDWIELDLILTPAGVTFPPETA